jgi:aminoglycoside/choline kinase family phosphotransferase
MRAVTHLQAQKTAEQEAARAEKEAQRAAKAAEKAQRDAVREAARKQKEVHGFTCTSLLCSGIGVPAMACSVIRALLVHGTASAWQPCW